MRLPIDCLLTEPPCLGQSLKKPEKSLNACAEVLAVLGEPLRAAQIWGATERLRTDIGSPLRPAWRKHCEDSIAAARSSLNDDAGFDKAWKEGSALSFDQALVLMFLDDQLDR